MSDPPAWALACAEDLTILQARHLIVELDRPLNFDLGADPDAPDPRPERLHLLASGTGAPPASEAKRPDRGFSRAATLTGAMSTGPTPGDPPESKRASSLVGLIVRPELSDGVRRAVIALWLAGAAIAGAIVPLATARQSPSSGALYAAVAAALVALAIGTARGTRWALRASLVLLGLQLFGAIGSAWQLAHGAADDKAAELKRLGVDPTLGLTLNLIYSAIAFSVFLWAWRRTRR